MWLWSLSDVIPRIDNPCKPLILQTTFYKLYHLNRYNSILLHVIEN